MNTRIMAAVAAFAIAAGSASARTAHFSLDTWTEGTRTAQTVETLAYSTDWNNASYVRILVDGNPVFSADASAIGVYSWSPRGLGVQSVVTFDDGVETYSVNYTVSRLSDTAVGETYSLQLPDLENVQTPYTWSLGYSGNVSEETGDDSSYDASLGVAQEWHDDDMCWELSLPFDFPFFGRTYHAVYVNSNGTLSFGNPCSYMYYNPLRFRAYPMIAVLWEDLQTDTGDIYVESSETSATIRWSCLYQYMDDSDSEVNASATLYPDGRIVLSYGDGNMYGGFIGISDGKGHTTAVSVDYYGSMENAPDIVFEPILDSLPEGLTLSSNGLISGTPVKEGDYEFVLRVEDAAGNESSWTTRLYIKESSVATMTQTTPVPVPYVWLESYFLAGSGDYEAAAFATAANGENTVWECYVAGLDPTNPDSRLLATIRMDGDTPVIGYLPPRPEYTPAEWYHVVGKTDLTDKGWEEQADGQRFFKVRIVIP